MRARKNKLLLALLFPWLMQAQVNLSFIRHLESQGLKVENRAYLNAIGGNTDSLHYAEARFYLHYFNDSAFIYHYKLSRRLCKADEQIMQQASILMLNADDAKYRREWFETIDTSATGNILKKIRLAYFAAEDPLNFKNDFEKSELSDSFGEYYGVMRKKPALAAAMSVLVPGLGKIYAGKTVSGINGFIINGVYAVQTWESNKRLGMYHPLTLFNAGTLAAFYLSNIYGSYKSIIDLRRERKKQFIKDATFLYN